MSAWYFDVNRDGEVWCVHRDVSCCPECFGRNPRFVDVGGVVYLVEDDAALTSMAASDGDGIVRMSPAYHKTHGKTTNRKSDAMNTMDGVTMTHDDYRANLNALSMGQHVDDETYAAMRSFAKAKKVKMPPPNNEPPTTRRRASSARRTNRGQVCNVDGCDRPANSLGMCKKHHTAHWRQTPENLERTRRAARKHAAKKRLAELAAKIGPGFHPDTRGADYTSLPDGVTPERVDKVVDDALTYGVDVYGVALDAVNAQTGEHGRA